MTQPDTAGIDKGIRNLLLGCAGLSPGDAILIVGEANAHPYFNPKVCRRVETGARALSLRPELCLVDANAPCIPTDIVARMHGVAATFFFSRLGGRARFDVPDVPGLIVNCHASSLAHLSRPFCTVDYAVQQAVHDALVADIAGSASYRITAPCGTDLTAHMPARRDDALAEFALRIFPVMIFPPILCPDLGGTLVIDHFVTSSGTRQYDNSILMLDTPLVAHLEAGRIVDVDGPGTLVDRLMLQMTQAAALTGGDPMRVNSWHTGINPNTFTDTVARHDPDRWGAVAFGAPRYTHFHASGHTPGDVAFSLFDATIAFDGTPFWQDGQFVFLDRPSARGLIPDDTDLSAATRHDIGV